ncbi:hypothetical protein [Burkholderia ubonensis]|uniref:hypothetical protein n=1 Tax=Burkholderia ubonensis TaxID=101571 RepID=UPI00076C7370|nr:hypothetical protein [Burkholderia ubonensis]KVD73388.1 hypothetical protein WI88_28095 [Burkholderia ubonensis]
MMTSISPLPLDVEWVAETAGNAMFNDRCRWILRPDWSDQFDSVSAGCRSSRQVVDADELLVYDDPVRAHGPPQVGRFIVGQFGINRPVEYQ